MNTLPCQMSISRKLMRSTHDGFQFHNRFQNSTYFAPMKIDSIPSLGKKINENNKIINEQWHK